MSFSLQYFLPQRLSSWIIRKLTRIETVWFKNLFIRIFSKIYKVKLDEYIIQDSNSYTSFNDFFTRAIKPEARPITEQDCIIPADGKIIALGTLANTEFIKAKGHHFTLEALLADQQLASEFKDGLYTTVYLSPSNYHRIHAPMDGTLLSTIHIPGKLFSVSLKTAEQIPNLFAQNERLVCVFKTEIGKVIVILVGAINVSSIQTTWHGVYKNPEILAYQHFKEGISFKKGDEIGRFNMGSTAIVILPKSTLQLNPALNENKIVQIGEALTSKSN